MKVAIHADAGPTIGVGHAVRSLALAEEAASRGHEVVLVGDIETPFVLNQVTAAGVRLLPAPRGRPGRLSRALAECAPDLVHLDTYEQVDGLDGVLISNVQDGKFGCRVADVLIDPSLGAEQDPLPYSGFSRLLRGAKYAAVRASVTVLRGAWRPRPQGREVLVVMGGTDAAGLEEGVLRALAAADLGLDVTVVTSSPRTPEPLPGLASLRYQPSTPHLPSLMADADLVVSAAGTSAVELCCIGVPMALVCAAENQRQGLDRLVGAEAALPLRLQEPTDLERLEEVLLDPQRRHALASSAAQLVDGLGAWRTVNAWESAANAPTLTQPRTLLSRPATSADADLLLEWRNDPTTRANSRQSTVLDRSSHLSWLDAALADRDRLLLIVADGAPVGTVRWDRRGPHSWEVSITVAPEARGRSLSLSVLAAGERFLASHDVDARELLAVVHRDNQPSLRLFAAMGYVLDLPADPQGFLQLAKAIPAS